MNKINFYGKEYEKLDDIICDCGCIFKKDTCDIGISYSDKFLCELHTPKIDIEDEKGNIKKQIKSECEKLIYAKYPEYKQRNIGIFGTDVERLEFKEYKENITAQFDNFVSQVDIITTEQEIKEYSFEFIIPED
jgi:hypothetical protein